MKGANTAWAWPSFMEDGYTDEWCRANTNQAVMSMPSHSAPLGITFYDAPSQEVYDREGCFGGFPASMNGYAFMAFHGSWNRDIPTGYKVVYVPFDDRGNPTAQPIDLMRSASDTSAKWLSNIRPVDVQFDRCGRLFVTEDGPGHVIRIDYSGSRDDDFVPVSTEVADGPSCREWEATSIPVEGINVTTPESTYVGSCVCNGSSAPCTVLGSLAMVLALAFTLSPPPTPPLPSIVERGTGHARTDSRGRGLSPRSTRPNLSPKVLPSSSSPPSTAYLPVARASSMVLFLTHFLLARASWTSLRPGAAARPPPGGNRPPLPPPRWKPRPAPRPAPNDDWIRGDSDAAAAAA
ncbi:hypothetical protein THAOC_26601, partial [Thalassiosira oceanica]